ncbi:MAG: ATP-binding protein, partial [Chitinivibrionales bacterium]|nr:ATP-binding protein [Chitinivibrionales bacterium]
DELLSAVDAIYDNPTDLLLDEIQNVDRWELLINRLQRQGRRLVVTGSNAHLLSSEFATHLTGRHIPLMLFPFSFNEYASVAIKKQPATQPEYQQHLYNYLRDGGYPEPLIKNIDRKTYLSTLLESIIYKDIVKRFKIRSVDGIEDLTRYLMSNVGSEYSYRTLAEVTKCKSAHTVEKYLKYLEEAFLFFSLRRFSYKVKEQAKANRKIYCIDNGFIEAGAFRVSEGTGRLAENAVAVRLRKRELDGECEVFFWKNVQQHEADFVVVRNRKVEQIIQVCWNIDKPTTKEREIRALVTAGEELKCKKLLILTEGKQGMEKVEWFGKKASVEFVPLWKWMMELGLKNN